VKAVGERESKYVSPDSAQKHNNYQFVNSINRPPLRHSLLIFGSNRFIQIVPKLVVAVIFVFLSASTFAAPPPGIFDEMHAAVQAVMAVQEEVTPALMQQAEMWALQLASMKLTIQR
jgi:hypothetical protein